MEVFRIERDWDEHGNSPWDALWYDGDPEDIDVLDCAMRLGAIWRSPAIRLEKRIQVPDIYGFHHHYAVSERAKALLLPVVEDAAEFLPLLPPGDRPLFVLHPLVRADLDEQSVVSASSVSGNITVIRKYSFAPSDLEEAMPVFQARQARGSAGRDARYPCTGVLVSLESCSVCRENALCGVAFTKVFGDG